jgi:hypothetical protein
MNSEIVLESLKRRFATGNIFVSKNSKTLKLIAVYVNKLSQFIPDIHGKEQEKTM